MMLPGPVAEAVSCRPNLSLPFRVRSQSQVDSGDEGGTPIRWEQSGIGWVPKNWMQTQTLDILPHLRKSAVMPFHAREGISFKYTSPPIYGKYTFLKSLHKVNSI